MVIPIPKPQDPLRYAWFISQKLAKQGGLAGLLPSPPDLIRGKTPHV